MYPILLVKPIHSGGPLCDDSRSSRTRIRHFVRLGPSDYPELMGTEQSHRSLVSEDSSTVPVIRTLLISDFVDSTALVERLGDQHVAQIFERHDAMARDLLAARGEQKIDKRDGLSFSFIDPRMRCMEREPEFCLPDSMRFLYE